MKLRWLEAAACNFVRGTINEYGEAGYFLKRNPITGKYTFSNWGSRLWEYKYTETMLKKWGAEGKRVVDIGIGLPSDSNFYKFYVENRVELTAYDLDSRLPAVTQLSEKCKILNKNSANMAEIQTGSVDIVVAISNFEHFDIDSFEKTLLEVNRILKPGGKFLITFDIVMDHAKPATWAILEKSVNGKPAVESDEVLGQEAKKLDLADYLNILSKYFAVPNTILNKDVLTKDLVHSDKWNSKIGYAVVTKR